MTLRKVTRTFEATRLDLKESATCSQLEGCDLSGDTRFTTDSSPLNDGFDKQGQRVNGREVVQFACGQSSFCVELSIYEASTKRLSRHEQ